MPGHMLERFQRTVIALFVVVLASSVAPDRIAAQSSGYGVWSTYPEWTGLDLRSKCDGPLPQGGSRAYHVEFRSRYRERISFSYVITGRGDPRPRDYSFRTHLRDGETTEVFADASGNACRGLTIYVGDVRFGESDVPGSPYAVPQRSTASVASASAPQANQRLRTAAGWTGVDQSGDYVNGAKAPQVEPPSATNSGVGQPAKPDVTQNSASAPFPPGNRPSTETPPSGPYAGAAPGPLTAPTGRPARYYPTQLFITIRGATPTGRRVQFACADINVGGVATRVLGYVSYYTSGPTSNGFFEVQATLTRPDMWLPADYPVNITAATNCARSGAYLVFDPLNTAVHVEYPSAGGLVGRSFRFEVLTR
jgi:hypothetical protein